MKRIEPWVREGVVCDKCHKGTLTQIYGPAYRRERKKLGLSLRAVCAKVGISAVYLSDIELERRQPAPATRRKLLAAIGVREEG